MLTGMWTPMNAAVMKSNQLYEKTLAHNGENDENHMARIGTSGKTPNRLCNEEVVFGDYELPRPPGLQTASSGSNPVAYQEFMAEQYDLDRKAKMQVLSQESEDRRRLIQAQKIAEDMKVLQIDTSGMDPTYAAIINA
ncbi:hypothetical protein Tco_1307134 [Tanacetum coccineum]